MMASILQRLFRSRPRPGDPGRFSRFTAVSLGKVRSIEDLSPTPLVYERTAFMAHIRRYEREALREYYLRQPVEGAHVWANYVVNLWEYEHGVEDVTSYPWNVTIPMTEVCNAVCTFCSSPLVPDPKALAVHEIHHFGDVLRHALRVSLQGLGEPLAHPHFEELAEEIRKYLSPVAQVEIITNGWLLAGRRWELLKSLRISDIQVSVNAATDRTHQVAMGSRPGTFDQVVRNIEHVLADRKWPWPSYLKASMVVTRHSLPEVPQFLDLFVRKGVRRFQFNALLPLTTPDWGFGHTDQYLDLWCGHLPQARELVGLATKAIARYRRKRIVITATPEQWLLPVSPSPQVSPIQLSTDQQSTAAFQSGSAPTLHRPEWRALCIWVNTRRVVLAPHDRHTEVSGPEEEDGVRFRGTPESRRWAYLFRTPRLSLGAGDYVLELRLEIHSGELYGGVLDVETDQFIIQEQLHSGCTQIKFALEANRVMDVVVRQGPVDVPVGGIYRYGRIIRGQGGEEVPGRESMATVPRDRQAQEWPEKLEVPEAPVVTSPSGGAGQSPTAPPSGLPGSAKPARIYCPMVYTTLSVFHHSLDVSICCYMEKAPGEGQPSLKSMPVLRAYNDAGFRLVRQTLNTDRHIPVCDSCPYGAFRS